MTDICTNTHCDKGWGEYTAWLISTSQSLFWFLTLWFSKQLVFPGIQHPSSTTHYPWAIFFPVIDFNYLPMPVSLDISIQSDGSFHSLHKPTEHLYTDIPCSSQKQFTQDKLYHLSFSSFSIYLPKKKKKKKWYHDAVVLARNLGISHSQILFVFQHPFCMPWSLPLWYNSQTFNWIYPYLVASVQHLFHSSTHPFIHSANISEKPSSLSISHLFMAVITCFVSQYHFHKI